MLFELRTTARCDFGKGPIEAGTVIGMVACDYCPSQLFNAIQYGHLTSTMVDETAMDKLVTGVVADEHVETSAQIAAAANADAATQNATSGTDTNSESDEDQTGIGDELREAGLAESLVVSLVKQKLGTLAELDQYVRSGKDLLDLDDVGKGRKEQILAALAIYNQPPQPAQTAE